MNGVRQLSLSLALLFTSFTAFADDVRNPRPIEILLEENATVFLYDDGTQDRFLAEPAVDPITAEVKTMLDKAQRENDYRRNMRAANLTETECLATAMYHEARGEGDVGMKAVAFVIHNRAKSGRYPADMCSVVLQHRQFSFTEDRNPDNIKQWKVYERALRMAVMLVNGGFASERSPVHDAMYFHALAKPSNWTYAKARKFITTLGNHHFFK